MKTLRFRFRGEGYEINEKNQIKANGLKDFSEDWLSQIQFKTDETFKAPEILNGFLVWDFDHGTVRRIIKNEIL